MVEHRQKVGSLRLKYARGGLAIGVFLFVLGFCGFFFLVFWYFGLFCFKSSEDTGLTQGSITDLSHPSCWEVETRGLLSFSKTQVQPPWSPMA